MKRIKEWNTNDCIVTIKLVRRKRRIRMELDENRIEQQATYKLAARCRDERCNKSITRTDQQKDEALFSFSQSFPSFTSFPLSIRSFILCPSQSNIVSTRNPQKKSIISERKKALMKIFQKSKYQTIHSFIANEKPQARLSKQMLECLRKPDLINEKVLEDAVKFY